MAVVVRTLKAIAAYGDRSPKRRLAIDACGLLLLLFVAFLIYRGAAQESRAAQQGQQAHDYLCYQKTVVIPQRIESTRQYVADVKAGRRKPIPNLTNADIALGAKRDKDALKALSRVKC